MNNIESKSGLKKKIISGAFWLGSLTFIGQLITWIITLFVIRLLTPDDYGLMAMAMVFIGFIMLLSEVGLGTAIIQSAEIDEIEIRKVFGVLILINIILFLLTLISAPLLASFFYEERLVPILRVLSINFIFLSLIFLPQSILMRRLEFRKKALLDLLGNIFSSFIILLLALMDYGVWALIWGMIAMYLFKSIAFNIPKDLRYLPIFSMKDVTQLLSFGGYVTLTRILWYFYTRADILIAGHLFGKKILGIYSVAMGLVTIPLDKISPIFIQIGIPAFSKIQDNLPLVQDNFLKLLRFASIIAFPFFIGLATIVPEVIPQVLGPKWLESIIPIQILCLVMPLRFIGLLYAPIVTGRGRPEIITGNMVYGIIIMTIAFFIGSYWWGMIGLCYSWLIAFPILFLIMTMRTFSVLEIPIWGFFKTIKIPVLGCLIMVSGIYSLKYLLVGLNPILLSIILIISGIFLYAGLLIFLDRNVFKDLKLFFSRS